VNEAGQVFRARVGEKPMFNAVEFIGHSFDDWGVFVHHGIEDQVKEVIRPPTAATGVSADELPTGVDTSQG
jgi:hypothetical protein